MAEVWTGAPSHNCVNTSRVTWPRVTTPSCAWPWASVGTEVNWQQATRWVMPICRAQAPRWFPGRRCTAPRDFTTVHKLDGFRFVKRWRDGRRCLLSEEERETLLVVFVTSKSLQYFTSYRGIPADTQNTAVVEMVRPGHVTTPAPLPPHRCFPQLLRFWWLQWDLLYINIPGCSQHNG